MISWRSADNKEATSGKLKIGSGNGIVFILVLICGAKYSGYCFSYVIDIHPKERSPACREKNQLFFPDILPQRSSEVLHEIAGTNEGVRNSTPENELLNFGMGNERNLLCSLNRKEGNMAYPFFFSKLY